MADNGIYQKIADLLAEIEEIPKTGKNAHFGYAFHEEQVVVEHLRPMLAEKGVVLVVRQGERHLEESDKGGKIVVAPTDVTFVDAEDGSSFTARVWGEGQDTQDKGSHKALVGAFKYALMKTFLISAGNDDPEHDRGVRRGGGSQQNNRPHRTPQQSDDDDFHCPDCGGPMWDNRDDDKASRNGGKRPDWKCKDKGCDNAIWGTHPEETKPDLIRGYMDVLTVQGKLTTEQATRCEDAIKSEDEDKMDRAIDWLRERATSEPEGVPA